jgi:uncharacterized membrane protein
MASESGYARLISFRDAVTAIAITLLILPLVDAASTTSHQDLHQFYDHNRSKLLVFVVSFVVIGRFWWGQHQLSDRLKSYNSVMVGAMFLWLLSIVFLPLPTELLGAGHTNSRAVESLYVGTMLVATMASLAQHWAAVRWPEVQDKGQGGQVPLSGSVALVVLMAVALILLNLIASVGLWALLVLVLADPLDNLVSRRRRQGRRGRP